MKRMTGALLLMVFVNANSSIGDLARLPVLLRHYLEHRQLEKVSFGDFWNCHYAKNLDHPDDRHKDHEQLPFKAGFCPSTVLLLHSTVPAPELSIEFLPEIFPVMKISEDQVYWSKGFHQNIWQPPRLA